MAWQCGHERTPENTYGKSSPRCRTCERERLGRVHTAWREAREAASEEGPWALVIWTPSLSVLDPLFFPTLDAARAVEPPDDVSHEIVYIARTPRITFPDIAELLRRGREMMPIPYPAQGGPRSRWDF